ncbi:MAG: hypothetical protein J0L84_04475 [Verrucomicrobia bacterium]|nr:hypothetical protein [Verrucomicrobiota bacterium]
MNPPRPLRPAARDTRPGGAHGGPWGGGSGMGGLLGLTLLWDSLTAAVHVPDWQHVQPVHVAGAGLVKASLPPETLNALRPGAADLRLLDPSGAEVAWILQRPQTPDPDPPIRAAKSLQVALQPQATVMTLETGSDQPVSGLQVAAGAGSFIKAARVDGSADGRSWRSIATGLPLYQNYQGESRLQLPLPPAVWGWLRITLDDARTAPVPISAVSLQVVGSGPPPVLETNAVPVLGREEGAGETRLRLDVGSANRDAVALELFSPEGYFTRRASLGVREWHRGEWRDQWIARDLVYRATPPGSDPEVPARFEIHRNLPSREVLWILENGDSPPLHISRITLLTVPVELVFWAREPGVHQLLAGNQDCPAPSYDLGAFSDRLRSVRPQGASFGALATNGAFQPKSVVPDPFALAGPLDVSGWQYRQSLSMAQAGPQVLELGLEVMSHARPDLGDVRLMSGGRQRPYLLEPHATLRSVRIQPSAADDPARPTVSRWSLTLPLAGAPVTALQLDSATPLFDRSVEVVEVWADPRGNTRRRVLGSIRWTRTPDGSPRPASIPLHHRPESASLWLEIRNGDNAPLSLTDVTAWYPVARLHFLGPVTPPTELYYGHPDATAPVYDLELVAAGLLNAASLPVTPGGEIRTGGRTPIPRGAWAGRGMWLFWIALSVVVAGLLFVLRRLLPAAAA